MTHPRQAQGCLSIIGAVALVVVSIPLGFYLLVYMLARRSGRLPAWIQGRIDFYYHPTYIGIEHVSRVPNLIAELGPQARILNVGSSVHANAYSTNIINLDITRTPITHVVADAHNIPFADASFDAVISLAVYEHLAQPWVVTAEIERVLKPGGTLYIEAPFFAPYHADPGDYYRYTIPGLRSMFRNFQEQEVGVCNGPGSMLTWTLTELVATMADIDGSFDSTRTHMAPSRYMRAKELGRLLFGWVKLLDKVLLHKEHSFVIAEGLYYHGVKQIHDLITILSSLSISVALGHWQRLP